MSLAHWSHMSTQSCVRFHNGKVAENDLYDIKISEWSINQKWLHWIFRSSSFIIMQCDTCKYTSYIILTAKIGGSRLRSIGFIMMKTCWFLWVNPLSSRIAAQKSKIVLSIHILFKSELILIYKLTISRKIDQNSSIPCRNIEPNHVFPKMQMEGLKAVPI